MPHTFAARFRTWCLGMAVLGVAGCAWAQATAPLRICHEDEDNYPWLIKGGKGANVILAEMAMARTGVTAVFEPMPWRRCLSLLEHGQVDGVLGVSYMDERARYAAYPMTHTAVPQPDESRRVNVDEYSLYRAVGSALGWNGKRFSGVTGPIGYQTAFSIEEQLRQWGVEPFDSSKSPEVLLRRVLKGNLQGAALLTLTADRLLTHPEFAGQIEKVTPPLVSKPFFLAFSKPYFQRNARAANALWAAIEQTRKSPDYQAREAAVLSSNK